MAVQVLIKSISNLSKINTKISKEIQSTLPKLALQLENRAKDRTRMVGAIRTGRYLNSIRAFWSLSDLQAGIHTNVYYAPFLEFGTRYMQARQIFTNTLQLMKNDIHLQFVEAIARATSQTYESIAEKSFATFSSPTSALFQTPQIDFTGTIKRFK